MNLYFLMRVSTLPQVKNIGSQDEGVYRCRVYNEAGETFSIKCNLSIFDRPPDYIASAKIALLIGNEDYRDRELQGLHAPSNDVATLAEILEDLGFHVIALQNLTYSEMSNAFKWFCRILPENAYVISNLYKEPPESAVGGTNRMDWPARRCHTTAAAARHGWRIVADKQLRCHI
ncbi:lymphoid tissue lymphoma translocation [Homalodisca vitripennis]|nr:lymphoid tissue lymphoma translocation [Homalodisca vitripennis]